MSVLGTGPEMGSDIVGLDARAVRASVQIVSRASAADLARPTPCPDWTLASTARASSPTMSLAMCGLTSGPTSGADMSAYASSYDTLTHIV